MAQKKAYPLRIGGEVLDAVRQWADDELRSVNAQIEYILRDSLRKSGRLKDGRNSASEREADKRQRIDKRQQ